MTAVDMAREYADVLRQRLGHRLSGKESLFEDRQIADYDWRGTVNQEMAETDLNSAERLVKACRERLKM